MQEKATKVAGFPAQAVEKLFTEAPSVPTWASLLQALNRRLIGDDGLQTTDSGETAEDAMVDESSMEGTGAYFNEGELVVPLYSTPGGELHLLVKDEAATLLCTHPPPMYIASTSVPAYVRLHLLARLIQACQNGEVGENGVGFLIASIGFLDQEWAVVEEDGAPDITSVLKHLLPSTDELQSETQAPLKAAKHNRSRNHGRTVRDTRTDIQVLQGFQNMCSKEEYAAMAAIRQRLPAFASKEDFIGLLESNRVVVVVGETGKPQLKSLLLNTEHYFIQGAARPHNVSISRLSIASFVHALNDA
jgi:ATP-dependent RNA helicase DHX57